jgi:hypothetical protein
MSSRSISVLSALAFFFGLAIVTLVQLPWNTMLWSEIQNTGHTFAFGLLALVALAFLRSSGISTSDRPLRDYLAAFAFCLVAGIAVELVQFKIGGDADPVDVLRDAVGIISFLGFYAVLDPRLAQYWKRKGGIWRTGATTLSLLLLLAGLLPLIGLSTAYLQRDRAFPVLIDFEAGWPMDFISTPNASLSTVPAPSEWHMHNESRVGRLILHPAQYPGLALLEPVTDWSGYAYLSFHIYSENPEAITLILRIHDRRHNYRFDDRFNTKLTIAPGDNAFRIPLEKIRSAPRNRKMDMKAIVNLMIFAVEPDQALQFYLSNIRLERD